MKKNKSKFWFFNFVFALATTPLALVSCIVPKTQQKEEENKSQAPQESQAKKEEGKWSKEIKLYLSTAWWDDKDQEENKIDNFINLFTKEFNKLKNAIPKTKNYPDVKFVFHSVEDNQVKIQQIAQKTADFAIVPSGNLAEYMLKRRKDYPNKKDDILPLLQTLTNGFIERASIARLSNRSFEKVHFKDLDINERYQDGTIVDPLRLMFSRYYRDDATNARANYFQHYFKNHPFKSWTDEEKQWTGARYNVFYGDNQENVDFYRGMVLLYGTDEEIKAITKAWDDKDWQTFRSFGISYRKNTSHGAFLLQEQLFKQHFNLADNTFTTLKEEMLKYPDDFTKADAATFATTGKKINLDDALAWAWTHNNGDGTKFSQEPNHSYSLLTVTNPLKYDIGIFRSDINKDQATLIASTFKVLGANKDPYGPKVGYNGYKIIEDEDFLEVYKKTYPDKFK